MKQLFIAMLMLVCISCEKGEDGPASYAGTYTYTMNYIRSHVEDGEWITDYTQENVTVEVEIQSDNLGGQVIFIRYDGLTDDEITSGSLIVTTNLNGGAFYNYNTDDGSQSLLCIYLYTGYEEYTGNFNLKSHHAQFNITYQSGRRLQFVTTTNK